MNSSPASTVSHRYGFLIFIGLLAAGSTALLQLRPEMESNFKAWLTTLIGLLAVIMLVIWFLLLSRFPWRTKMVGLAVIVAGVAAFKSIIRVDGAVDGRGLPKLAWVWTAKQSLAAPQLPAAIAITAKSDIPDVPQFFGPERDGVVHGAMLNHDWKTNPPKQLWRQPVGIGWSAFSVAGGRAFTMEQRGEDELVTCYDVATGTLVWSHAHLKVRFVEWQGGDGPRSTPTFAQDHVYALGATGILDSLKASDGSPVWSRNVLEENHQSNITWGKSIAPLVYDNVVVVTGGNESGHCLFAYNRETGEPLWQAGDDQGSYASPTLVTLAGKKVVLSSNANTLTAHDPSTGMVLLSYPWGSSKWPRAAQPTIVPGDRIFLSAGYGMGCLMLQIRATAEGKLTATELWHNNKMKTQFNSVHVLNGHIYGLDDGGLACMKIETGERLWKDGRFGAGQSLLVDDAVLIQSERGEVVLAEASPTGFKALAQLSALNSKTWNHPVLAGRYLLVRNDQEMVCYEMPSGR